MPTEFRDQKVFTMPEYEDEKNRRARRVSEGMTRAINDGLEDVSTDVQRKNTTWSMEELDWLVKYSVELNEEFSCLFSPFMVSTSPVCSAETPEPERELPTFFNDLISRLTMLRTKLIMLREQMERVQL